ncbi:MAG: fumarylacetoacetate hydrolase family protein [Deltaproteobacteria bacterium]|nr:fumarylacetoacetate hydrolase family protein [Deltaproteobacteria bacterium]
MKVARLLVPERATPVLALVCDGALYDVATLERSFGNEEPHGDFFERVVVARGAGLDALQARLVAGRRPTESRILEPGGFPLPPFDPQRGAYVQLGPADEDAVVPGYQHRDARAVVGDGQPVPVFGEPSFVDVGMAVLMGDDLEAASAAEALRAAVGFSLLLEWCAEDAWSRLAAPPISQLGATLVMERLDRFNERTLVVTRGAARRETAPIGRRTFAVADSLAYLSHRVALRAGDVVGLGRVVGGREPIRAGELVSVALPGVVSLHGRAVRVPIPSARRLETVARSIASRPACGPSGGGDLEHAADGQPGRGR